MSILHTITNCLGPFQLSKEALNLLHFTTCMSNAYTYYNKPTTLYLVIFHWCTILWALIEYRLEQLKLFKLSMHHGSFHWHFWSFIIHLSQTTAVDHHLSKASSQSYATYNSTLYVFIGRQMLHMILFESV